jgi:hypothetical protein
MVEPAEDLKALIARVEKVERQNRILRVLGLIILFPLLIWGSIGVAISEKGPSVLSAAIVEAGQFHLINEGKVTAKLATVYGGPSLSFYDETGQIMMMMNVTFGNASLSLSGKTKKNLIKLGVIDGRIPMVLINDTAGKSRIGLGLREDTSDPRIVLSNANGKAIWEAGAPPIK